MVFSDIQTVDFQLRVFTLLPQFLCDEGSCQGPRLEDKLLWALAFGEVFRESLRTKRICSKILLAF